jgi:hypothetical protein
MAIVIRIVINVVSLYILYKIVSALTTKAVHGAVELGVEDMKRQKKELGIFDIRKRRELNKGINAGNQILGVKQPKKKRWYTK